MSASSAIATKGIYEAAQNICERALKTVKENDWVYECLGSVQEDLGNIEAARRAYQTFINRNHDPERLAKAREALGRLDKNSAAAR
jgi:tetratricopeptide (TPR) repeat protein